ncbi:hypothetical protein CC86DRAFT_305737 [Ophiobolus disseminans]|uniref:Uncharacterized protein n=1 Tax=Ophiobolus disseminans TaxID=1469910 RepID=A0A6A6ZIT0_9PLEO|nr:hypothetical protein CC86DRAFT_305737 [Ophiobolus disseminans]
MGLCGSLYNSHTLDRSEISTLRRFYESGHLKLLSIYFKRILTHDSDILNAFSGIIRAHSRVLGKFHWGLPLNLFASALLATYLTPHYLTRQPGFPSWSWLG